MLKSVALIKAYGTAVTPDRDRDWSRRLQRERVAMIGIARKPELDHGHGHQAASLYRNLQLHIGAVDELQGQLAARDSHRHHKVSSQEIRVVVERFNLLTMNTTCIP